MKTFNIIEAIEINKKFSVRISSPTKGIVLLPTRVFKPNELEKELKENLLNSNIIFEKWRIHHQAIQFDCHWNRDKDNVNYPVFPEVEIENKLDELSRMKLKTRVTIEVLE